METTLHFLPYCPNFMEYRNTLLRKISEINSELVTRNNSFSQYNNSRVLDATTAFLVTSKRLDDPLLV